MAEQPTTLAGPQTAPGMPPPNEPPANDAAAAAASPDDGATASQTWSVDNMPPPGVPKEVHIDRTHPDLAGMRTKNDASYTYEFYNEESNSGPHLAMTTLWRGANFKADRANFLMSHPHVRIAWDTVKMFPHAFAAMAYLETRKKELYLKDPSRIGAEEMYPDAANRIFAAGKPE